MVNKEELGIDIFVKYSSYNLDNYKRALQKGKMIMLKDIQLDERFNPRKYFRYYITLRVINLEENKPIPKYNITNQKIERLHNAAITLEFFEARLEGLKSKSDNLFFYYEIGGIYLLEDNNQFNTEQWYQI